ncbi:diguanylate cyclase [Methylomonas sp. AM2-LC]|uniref:diguanylate cyclase n=1 Tax=Methylomonas sp. AM2-LC TaxID=3153301 RepID=UPI0032665660
MAFATETPSGDSVDIQLRWHHQFQFAGYYAALEKGFYQDEGFTVNLHAGDPEHQPVTEVLSGHALYAEGNSEVLYQRLLGKPLVALAVIFQHSPSILLVRKESGITGADGLRNKKIMLMNVTEDADFLTVFLREGIPLNQLNIVPSSYNINDLITGKVDAFNSYITNEPYLLKQQNIAYNIIDPSQYGVDFYSDILFTTEKELHDHPQRVAAIKRATLKGWRYAMDHPQEIIELLKSKYAVSKSIEHLNYEATTMRALIYPDLIEIGHMNTDRWQRMADTFVRAGLVSNTNTLQGFIYAPHAEEKWPRWLLPMLLVGVVLLVFAVIVGFYFFRMHRDMLDAQTKLLEVNNQLTNEIIERKAVEDSLRKSESQYQRLAHIDYLTGLSNRRYFMEQAEAEFTRIIRYGGELSLLMLDLDNFKLINDRYGHQSGDLVLQMFGSLARATVRDIDVIGRLGGEEFAIILPETSENKAIEVAERFRDLVSQAVVTVEEGIDIQFTVSIGVATLNQSCVSLSKLFVEADQALYKAKSEGRNRVCPEPQVYSN